MMTDNVTTPSGNERTPRREVLLIHEVSRADRDAVAAAKPPLETAAFDGELSDED